MFKMLIVDDEQFEREGVKFLIDKYDLQLEIHEADSGESALAFMKQNHVDILFTDIRMKGMDGLQLAAAVRELAIPVKVIFMSAYGDFEYAQKAIDVNAIRYILKPVQVNEFLKVISQVIHMCEKEKQEEERQKQLEKAYGQGIIRHEKQRLVSQLIHGEIDDLQLQHESFELQAPIPMLTGSRALRMVMLDARSRVFDLSDLDLERLISECVQRQHEGFNLNEYQSMLFMEVLEGDTTADMEAIGNRILQQFKKKYDTDLFAAFSGPIDNIGSLRIAYNEIESILESKFFYDKGAVLIAESAWIDGHSSDSVEEKMSEIAKDVERKDFQSARMRFETLVELLKAGKQISSIYLKYSCMEILKMMFDYAPKKNTEQFKKNLEQIYKSNKLSELCMLMISALESCETTDGQTADSNNRKVTEFILRTIHNEYKRDLSVEELAESVYLSPNYLSHLFKKQVGVSIIKYITNTRMKKAKELLAETNKKVADISEETGYSNMAYFCSLFKSHFGMTPTQFREELGI
ncbi:response regulator [Paenibacillus sp. CF384]|uniref:response regulator transcription factor n=1 Tax=Paenibacillus sp. CF384 TaxID=1884382 RepID=UPI00089602C2|nr:response regulator [Paenibacillus sp. CF384]SDX97622.1 two-component system, response regulator YesN [Paenibacillus sp. CF384]